jgi:hypothetical protein
MIASRPRMRLSGAPFAPPGHHHSRFVIAKGELFEAQPKLVLKRWPPGLIFSLFTLTQQE